MQWPPYPNPPNHPHPLFPSLVQPQDITLISMSHFGKLSFWTFTLEFCWHIFKNVVGVHSSAEDMWNEWTSMSDDKVTVREIDFSCIFSGTCISQVGRSTSYLWAMPVLSVRKTRPTVIIGTKDLTPTLHQQSIRWKIFSKGHGPTSQWLLTEHQMKITITTHRLYASTSQCLWCGSICNFASSFYKQKHVL